MAIDDPVAVNISGPQQLIASKMNKSLQMSAGGPEGVDDEFEDEFTLKMTDEELLRKANQIETKYASYEAPIKLRQQANKTYYLGKQKEGSVLSTTDGQPIAANIIFEAEETFIPAALSKNPEPVVWADNTEEGNILSNDIKTMLQYHADQLVLRRKLARGVRNWTLDFLAVWKHGWDDEIKEIDFDLRDVKNFVFDPEGYVDCYGDFQGMLGERISIPASKMIELFPSKKALIIVVADGKMGTMCTYTQWWSDEYYFCTFKGEVLEKNKNPFFNYNKTTKEVDIDGLPTENEVKGKNHFAKPKKPYTFLSVFALGNQPHDITGLVEQNIPNQRKITRREDQIDFNLSRQNNSDIFSENNFNQETAKQAAVAKAKGHPILVPAGGPITAAIHTLETHGIDASFFTDLENSKEMLRSSFGTAGITPNSQQNEETARGMILNQQHDSTRIGGGIGDALEQVADNIFNWWTQLYYVEYTEKHFAAIMGRQKAVEYVEIQSSDIDRRLIVSVTPDSMKPKDETSEMNLALELWKSEAIDIKTLLVMLNVPDPQKTAGQVWLYKSNPQMYGQLNFPELQQQIQQLMAMGQGAATQGDTQGGQVQEQPGSPPETLSAPPASAALSQVPISTQATPA